MTESERYVVVEAEQTYKGLSYNEWVARWTNWVFSDDPDSIEVQGDVLFLRGNLEYSQHIAGAKAVGLLTAQDEDRWKAFYNRTGDSCVVISDDTAIFLPILSDTEFFGGQSEVGVLPTEDQARHIARINTDESGPIWATIQKYGGQATALCPDLKKYRITSSAFKLRISDKNPYWKYILNNQVNPGEYDAITDGFFVLITDVPQGSYRIQFGGRGRLSQDYRTDSVYDIHVTRAFPRKSTVIDISTKRGQSISFAPGGIPTRNPGRLVEFKHNIK